MAQYIKIKKGLNIKLVGEADKKVSILPTPETFAVKPSNFAEINPKISVKEGEEIQAGAPLFSSKSNELIKFCSPVSGEILEIVRGEKRKILEIRILADKETDYVPFDKENPNNLSRQNIVDKLLDAGAWPFIRQRPFGIIANPTDRPKAIFISAYDTNPLAPDNNFVLKGNEEDFETGLNVLQKLTEGKVHLNICESQGAARFFRDQKGIVINRILGPHPAGNVGVQIHHIDPLNKGEVVWYLYPQDVFVLGRLFNHGKFDVTRIIALTGSQVENPKYYKAILGTSIKSILVDGGLKAGENRIISGNVLTGKQIPENGYLNFYDYQITVIPEGHHPEFMGWLKPGFEKFSMSRTFFSWLTPKRNRDLDTNMHGEERPFVVTGEYEKVFPMDIYPVQLLKSILIEDIEMMENLGIYEVVEEDFALCEFICTSKIESQDIIRRGIELIRKEMS